MSRDLPPDISMVTKSTILLDLNLTTVCYENPPGLICFNVRGHETPTNTQHNIFIRVQWMKLEKAAEFS